MEHINISLNYKSGYNNGWPLISLYCNNQFIDCFEASAENYTVTFPVSTGPVSFVIEHWGKNPVTDSFPSDKFFELIDLTINDIPCKRILNDTIKKNRPTPWDKNFNVSTGDTYLGHNSTLEIRLSSPIKSWLQTILGSAQKQIQGQETTREMLAEAKKFFKIESR
jgi:hypothetical protein